MKILLVNTHDKDGGAAIACKRLHLALIAQGYDCKLLVIKAELSLTETYSYEENKTVFGKLLKKINQKRFNYYFYRQYSNKPVGHYLHSPALSLFDITKHELYEWADVVNLHWVSHFINFSSFFSHKNTKPVIWTLHDMNPFTGGCHHAENCEAFKASCEKCPQLSMKHQDYNHLNWLIKYKTHFNNLTIVSPSQWLQKQSLSSSLFKHQQHYVILNPIDTNIFKVYDKTFCRNLFNIEKNKKTILFVAQVLSLPLKGMRYLLDILNRFDDEVNILVAGKLDIDDLSEKIIPLGIITDERLMALVYNAADIFVLPSMAENLPNVIIESLCCGTPVVAFEVGGIPEIVKDKSNGFIVEKGNSKDLLSYLNKALTFEWDRDLISQEAQNNYNFNECANQYTNIFRKVLSKNS